MTDETTARDLLSTLMAEMAEEFAAAHARWLAAFEAAPAGSEEERLAVARMDVWDVVVARLRETAAKLDGAEEQR